MPRLQVLPETLFGRLFVTMLGMALVLLLVAAGLWHRQAFALLDREAEVHLESTARRLMTEWRSLKNSEGSPDWDAALNRLLASGGNAGWITNVYWVEFQRHAPRFVASYSAKMPVDTDLLPPSIEDVDDLIEDGMLALEDGRTFFPNPTTLNVARRCKIVLVPMLDRDGLVGGVVGVEADLQYMDLFALMRQATVHALLWAVPLCVITSIILAGSVSRRVGLLVAGLEKIGRNELPDTDHLGITELDRLQEGLRQLYERLAEREARLRAVHEENIRELAFTGSAIAHEVRNPLSAIGMHLGLLRRRYSPEGADAETFQEIQGQLEQLKLLTDRFLGYSREVKPVCERFRPADLIREAISARSPAGKETGIRSSVSSDFEMSGDIMMWRQIIDNLIDNAVSACRPGDIVINIEAYIKNDSIVFRFEDNGPGVPPNLEPRLFTPFSTGRPDGHGIGLALVRKFVEAHNGMIRYEPAPSGGAVFQIEVPINT